MSFYPFSWISMHAQHGTYLVSLAKWWAVFGRRQGEGRGWGSAYGAWSPHAPTACGDIKVVGDRLRSDRRIGRLSCAAAS